MLLRSIDRSTGLCNSTRLTLIRLGNNIIKAKFLTRCKEGDTILIPSISLTSTDFANLHVKIQRRPFPVTLCFAMTINKREG